MKNTNLAWGAAIAMIALFLSTSKPDRHCAEGSGYLTKKDTQMPCLAQHTYTMQQGVAGQLTYSATPDSVGYAYTRSGHSPQSMKLARTADAVRECALLHNHILTKTQYGGR